MATVKVTLNELRAVIAEETKSINENIGFATQRNLGVVPTNFSEFKTCIAEAFTRLNMKQIAGAAMQVNESAMWTHLEKMWTTVDTEMRGRFTPAPTFAEGREFWNHFAGEIEVELSKMVESVLPGTKLAKGNSLNVARAALDILKSGVGVRLSEGKTEQKKDDAEDKDDNDPAVLPDDSDILLDEESDSVLVPAEVQYSLKKYFAAMGLAGKMPKHARFK